MAIRVYTEENRKFFEVYVNGFDSKGERIQRKRRGIETLRKAETIEFELMRELAQLKEQQVEPRWEEWLEKCFARMKIELMPSTVQNYQSQFKKRITSHWTGKELSQITKSDVYEVIFNKCPDVKTDHSRKNLLKMVKRIFQMAVEEGLIDRNPCAGVNIRLPEVAQKVLTSSEVDVLLKEGKLVGHRFYSIWVFALMTGMRSGEMYALKWSDMDLDAKTISVTKQWTSKNGYCPTKSRRNRVVPISDALLKFLKELKLISGSSEFVLPRLPEWENGEQAKVLKEFCISIGITPIKFHDLRATFITNLLARGESLARVMAMVGHSELKTTNLYLRKAGVDIMGGTDKLSYGPPSGSEGKILRLANTSWKP